MKPPSSFNSKWLKKKKKMTSQLMENGQLFYQKKNGHKYPKKV